MEYYRSENVRLPSDNEAREAITKKINYTRTRSGKVKIYTKEEIEALNHPEVHVSFSVWKVERSWRWLIESKGCGTKWKM